MRRFLLIFLPLVFISCDSKPLEDPAKTVSNPAASGFVEENEMCICTKEYNPVCGSNGVTYPSPCQAGCDKITEFTQGECKK